MKSTIKVFVAFLIFNFQFLIVKGQISINETGNTPDASAMLDVSSTNKGILIPRMDSTSRKAISNPADGLMVYDSTTNSFWFYANASWNNLNSTFLADTDADTKIQVEENGDDDVIRFDMNGTEFMRLDSGRMEIVNTGNSIFIGQNAGASDDYSDNENIALGNDALANVANHTKNVAIGNNALNTMIVGDNNISIGINSMSNLNSSGGNIALGANAMENTSSANSNFNVAIGHLVGQNLDGQKNILIGYQAGKNTTGDSNVFIGHNVGNNIDVSNRLYIDNSNTTTPLLYGEFDNDILTINGQLNTTDTTTISSALFVNDNAKAQSLVLNTNNDTLDASAILDISSANKGVLIPRMNSTARNTIANPATGLMVYDTSTVTFWYYDNNQWNEIRNGSDQLSITDITENLNLPVDYSCADVESSLSFSNNAYNVEIAGNYAYILINGSVNVVDISNPASPVVVSTQSVGGSNAGAIDIVGNYLYASRDNIMSVIDISNPLALSSVGSVSGPMFSDIQSIAVSGNYAYITSITNHEIAIVDISNPSSPSYQTAFSANYPVDIEIVGNYAYFTSATDSELKVIDLSSSPTLSLHHEFAIGGYPTRLEIVGNYAYVTDYLNKGFKIVDISNPSALSLVSSISIGTSPWEVAVSGNYAYIVDLGGNDLKIVDISNPTAPFLKDSISLGNVGNSNVYMEISGNYAYITDYNSDELKVVNIAPCAVNIGYNPVSGTFTADTVSLANHIAYDNIQLNNQYLSNDGDNEGISIDDDGNVTLSNSLTINDDLLAGTNDMSYGGSGDEAKVIFDKSQFAFRTGRANNTNWDEASLGLYSFGTGTNTLATGNNSAAFGYQTLASGTHAFAGGNQSEATGHLSFAYGREVFAPSYGEVALGLYSTTYTPDDATAFDVDDRLFVVGNGTGSNNRSDAMIIYKDGSAWIQGDLTVNSTTYTSDIRLKENISNSKYGLQDILKIAVKDYQFKKDSSQHIHTGFLAQQLNTVFPHAVHIGGKDENQNPWTVDYASLTPLLVKGIQEQQQVIEQQQEEINELKAQLGKVNQLEQQNAEMKAMLEQIQEQLLSEKLNTSTN